MYLGVEENFLNPLTTLFTESSMSFSDTLFRRARIANIPASVHTDRSSAPVVLGQSRAISEYRMSRSTFIFLAWIFLGIGLIGLDWIELVGGWDWRGWECGAEKERRRERRQ